jgi:hypothetical protein
MHITLTPVRLDTPLTLHRNGDVLTINGVTYDFGPLPEGAILPRAAVDCDWLASDVERIGGVLHLTLILPHGAHAPEVARHPAPITLTGDGPVTLPPHDIEEPAA